MPFRTDTECPCGDGAVEEGSAVTFAMEQLDASWGHGDGAVEEGPGSQGSHRPEERFNGATAMEPWKRPTSARRAHAMNQLQWGHGDGAVEEGKDGDGEAAEGFASMGPRRWSRGRAGERGATQWMPYCFNGATAMEPWKSSCPDHCSTGPHWLQWGHGEGAVEELGRWLPILLGSNRLHWGHGDGAVEEG